MLNTATANHSFSKQLELNSIDASWEVPNELPRLAARDVHVWKIDLDTLTPEVFPQNLANRVEADEASSYRYAADRTRHRKAGMALRTILAGYISGDAIGIRFDRTAFGKPVLSRKDQFGNIEFNVSYSGPTALIGICKDAGIGVDVERVDPQFPVANVLRRFSDRGLFAIDQQRHDSDVRSFFELWTRNEAYAKATGRGLAGLAADNAEAQFTGRHFAAAQDVWSITSFDVENDLVAAVATPFKPAAVFFLKYQDRDHVRNRGHLR